MRLYEDTAPEVLNVTDLLDQEMPAENPENKGETGDGEAEAQDIRSQLRLLALSGDAARTGLAKVALGTRAAISALKEEEARLHRRRKIMENKLGIIMEVLDQYCGGETTDLGVATLYYRKNTRIEVSDVYAAAAWLLENGYTDCFHQPDPEIRRTQVGHLLDEGIQVPGVERITGKSCCLR